MKTSPINLESLVTESTVREQIFEYLQRRNIFCWKDNQPNRKARGVGFRRKGIADILGIYQGRPMAIEVKKTGGVLTTHQYEFLTRFKTEGGIAFIATSIEDVQKGLSEKSA